VAGRAVERNGFQLLRVQLSGPRRDHPGHLFPLFRLCRPTPAPARSGDSSGGRPKTVFTLVWIGPALFFFTFIYLKFVNSGYLLALAPPACAWMGLWPQPGYASIHWPRALKIVAIGGCAAANTLVFVCAPVYCSYGAVRRFEAELRNIIEVLPQIASPRDSLIVGFDSHFLGYRHAGYYLPDYLTVQFPEVQLASERVFAMQDRDTWLERGLPATAVHNFVLFPLPLGASEYSDYMALVRKRFPPGELRTAMRGGHEFCCRTHRGSRSSVSRRRSRADPCTGGDYGHTLSEQPLTAAWSAGLWLHRNELI